MSKPTLEELEARNRILLRQVKDFRDLTKLMINRNIGRGALIGGFYLRTKNEELTNLIKSIEND